MTLPRHLLSSLLLLAALSLTALSHAQAPADTAPATDNPPQRPVFVSRDPDELRERAVNFLMSASAGESGTSRGSSVSTRGGTLSVQQLAYDLAGMTSSEIASLAYEVSDIREFFQAQQAAD